MALSALHEHFVALFRHYILTRDEARTITVGVSGFQTQQGILWGPLAAAAVICVVPMLMVALLLQRYIVRGLTFGAVRG